MLWIRKNMKKYGFALVLYLFWDINSFKSEKGNTAKLSRTGFSYKQKRSILLPLNCKRFILKCNAIFLEFWFSYRSNHNAVVF